MHHPTKAVRAALSLSFLLATACDDDTPQADGGDTSSIRDGGAEDGGDGGDEAGREPDGSDDGGEPDGGNDGDDDPLYAFTTQIFGTSESENISYVVLSDSLDFDSLDVDDAALSVPGRALAVGPDGGGVLFVGGDAAGTLTRYDVTEDGELEEGDTVDFAAKGVSAIGEYAGQFHFAADDKAYFFDGRTAQIVVWNPEEMTVTGDISLSELAMENTVLGFSAAPLVREGELITFAGWRTMTEVPSMAAVVILDTEDDDVTVVTDDRCGYVRDGVFHDDGYIYMATENYGSAVHRLNEDNAPPPCMLRFDPEAQEFDPDFMVELEELFDGTTAGTLVRGPDDGAYLASLDEDAFEIMDDTHPRVLASAAGAWPWSRVILGDEPEIESLDTPPGNGSVVLQVLGEQYFIPQYIERSSTEFREITDDGPQEAAFSVEGLVFSAVKVR